MALEQYLETKGREYAPFQKDRAKRIYQKLQPHLSLPCFKIQIIGTNGKGSTGRLIALGLLQNHQSVLHFTSPHLLDFRERFYKNGACITKEALQQAHEFLQQFDFMQECSYFEYATFLALVLAQDVDFLILEAGLGGEFDSTSCVKSDISVFSMIGWDHQEFLGNTLKSIATTKLNAMQKIAFLSPQKYQEVTLIAKEIAHLKQAHLTILQMQNHPYEEILKTCKIGFLKQNFLSALSVLSFLKMELPKNIDGFDLRGRFEQIAPNIIVDVGHNLDSAVQIKELLGKNKVTLIYNAYRDKNIKEILKILRANIKEVLLYALENPRVIAKKDLCMILDSLKIAYRDFDVIKQNEQYLVYGSFSVVAKFLEDYDAK